MRPGLNGIDFVTLALILVFAILNAALYSGAVVSADAVSNPALVAQGVPAGSAPGVPGQEPLTPSQRAELDDSATLPGRFVPNQGRRHTGQYPLDQRVEFCGEGEVDSTCYASNPPTSGLHIPVQRNVRLADGNRVNLPPDPGIYPFEIPRESIPHIQEHAGVFVGYRCETDPCRQAVERLAGVVNEELSLGGRVVMAPDSDLAVDTIGMASWTRVDTYPAAEYTDDRARAFIKAHSCRFDPEGFCDQQPVN
jgi:hypothetical protein